MAQLLKQANGEVFKVNGQEVYEAISSGVVKHVNIDGRNLVIIGTDETKDRDGDILRVSGWQLENYRKNPVFLWSHNYSSVPLGRAEKVTKRKDPPRLEYSIIFPTKGLHPFADMILELYGEKIINASSVGFIPEKWVELERDDEGKGVRTTYGREYLKQELLELSGCAVPCNPNALQNALQSKMFLDAPFAEVQKWLQGEGIPPIPAKSDDVKGELAGKEAEYEDETRSIMVQVPDNICSIEEEVLEADKLVVEEEKSFKIEESINKILAQLVLVSEDIQSLKSIVTGLAQPLDLSLQSGKDGKVASEIILGDAFKQGKALNPPNPVPATPQYDFSVVIGALKDLQTTLKQIK